jgi:hypothetical protein
MVVSLSAGFTGNFTAPFTRGLLDRAAVNRDRTNSETNEPGTCFRVSYVP